MKTFLNNFVSIIVNKISFDLTFKNQSFYRFVLLTSFLLLIVGNGFSQITYDISKMKRIMVEKLIKTKDSNVVYLEIKFGEFEIINLKDIPQLENKIIKKVQYVYTDYPKDYNYSELHFKRFASLFVEFKSVFNKP